MPIQEEMMQQAQTPLSVNETKELMQDTIILDTRTPEIFAQGFIPGSINIALNDQFIKWIKKLIDTDRQLILVTEPGKESDSIGQLSEAGHTHFSGFVNGGFKAWQQAGEETDLIIDVEADELAMDIPFDDNLMIMDVRTPAEFSEGHVKNALNIPLDDFKDLVTLASIEEDQNVYIHCDSGYRSSIAASLLKRQGIHNLRIVTGGWESIKNEHKIEKEKDNSILN